MNNKYMAFMGMGFELVGIILVAVYVGQWIDKTYNTQGLGLAGFALIGLAGWITHIVVMTKKLEKNDTKPD